MTKLSYLGLVKEYNQYKKVMQKALLAKDVELKNARIDNKKLRIKLKRLFMSKQGETCEYALDCSSFSGECKALRSECAKLIRLKRAEIIKEVEDAATS